MCKRYENYKDSGVEWIGEIPEHWDYAKLKHIATMVYGDSLPSEVRANGSISVYGSGGIIGYHNNANTSAPVIVIGRKGSYGSLFYSVQPVFVIDTAYYIDIFTCESDLKWLFYLLLLLELNKMSQDTGVPGLSRNYAYEKIIPMVLLEEQKAIANFLDYKTSEIDSLIADKEELIKRLEEYKQSIITEAVTKGLKPDVKMKDSGIEWIGEVPEHWEISKVNRFYDICLGKMIQQSSITPYDTLEKYLCAVNVTWNGVDISNIKEMWFSQAEKDRYKLHDGDLVVCEGGEAGRASIWGGYTENCYIQNAVHRVRGKNNNQNKYLYYWLYFAKHIGYIDLLCNKATIMHLTREKLANLLVAIPEPIEQSLIVKHLDYKVEEINSLKLDVKNHINILKSYRQSLIYEAVTGKIDVRNHQFERSEQFA